MRTRTLDRLKRLGIGRDGLTFARKFSSLAAFWDACERADWLLCVVVQGRMLNKTTALKLASAFAKRTPTRISKLWVSRVEQSESDSDAAGDAWAASYASAQGVAYARTRDFDAGAFLHEMHWQARTIKRIAGNPFRDIRSPLK